MSDMPILFVSHGSPSLAIEPSETADFFRTLAKNLPTPKAIVVISAHWGSDYPKITGSKQLKTIHDFYGFPDELYRLHYDAKGDPQLAEQLRILLEHAGIQAEIDPERGLDHGAWNPLLLIYPQADIPVIQLSLQPKKDAVWHYKIGQTIASLAKQEVLIIASGGITHNLYQALSVHHKTTPSWVSEFANWVQENTLNGDVETLLDWQNAPYAKENHPTSEHFLPFFVALGAASKPLNAKLIHKSNMLGVLAMDAYSFIA